MWRWLKNRESRNTKDFSQEYLWVLLRGGRAFAEISSAPPRALERLVLAPSARRHWVRPGQPSLRVVSTGGGPGGHPHYTRLVQRSKGQ